MPMQDELPNNPLKLPFFVVGIFLLVFLRVVSATDGLWLVVALLAIAIAGNLHSIRIIRHGRNPRWLRSPLDRRWQRRSRGTVGR
jgi:hypothetical protein